MNKRIAFFDADSRELNEHNALDFRPRVRPIADKLNMMYKFIEENDYVLVFNTCCSGKMLMPDSRDDILYVPLDANETAWKKDIDNYRLIYLQKSPKCNVEADVTQNETSIFSENRNGSILMKELNIKEWVIFGNGLDFCVDNAVKSILKAGCNVTFISDLMISSATGYENSGTERSKMKVFEAWINLGAKQTTLQDFMMQ